MKPQTVAVFGGGRWSRVLVDVLASTLPMGSAVQWVTSNNYSQALEWTEERKPQTPVHVVRRLESFAELDAAVVATATQNHAETAVPLLEAGVPTLIEKPFALTREDAETLKGLAQQCVAGVNFEFMNAAYMRDFRKDIAGVEVQDISVVWQDPPMEVRHGETKLADHSFSLSHDSLPHCWSLLRALLPEDGFERVDSVSYMPSLGVIELKGTLESRVPVTISLSRHGERRRREIVVNGGDCILDFSTEPGFRSINGERRENMPGPSGTIATTLRQFLDVVEKPEARQSWPLSLDNCYSSVPLAVQSESLLQDVFARELDLLIRNGELRADSVSCRHLLLDMYGPRVLQGELRYTSRTKEAQDRLIQTIIEGIMLEKGK